MKGTKMKTLIVYYSMQGHTKRAAQMIADKIGADLLEIKPKRNYNMATALTVGRAHINSKHLPPIKPLDLNINDYDEIILGTPVWWYTFAPHVRTFISENNLSGKTIRLFSTHQGANGSTFKDLKETIGDVEYIGQKDFSGKKTSVEAQIDNWLAIRTVD